MNSKTKAKLAFFGLEGAWILGSTLHDQWERNHYFTEARALADKLGKPLANIGCGDWTVTLFPRALTESDVNVDVVPRDVPNFQLADIENLPFTDKQFGVVWTSHTFEHLKNPDKALEEIRRVSDYQYIIVPSWWSSSATLWPEHRWVYIGGVEDRVVNIGLANLFLLGAINFAVLVW